MQFYSTSDIKIAVIPWRIDPPENSATIIAKATFAMSPSGAPSLAEEQRPLTGDELEGASPSYDADFAPFKPRADLLLAGSAFAPRGGEVRQLNCTFGVGPYRRTLRISGDREWPRGALVRGATAPELFSEIPLTWDRAFGGEGYKKNPIGIGRRRLEDEDGSRHPLPNIEDPDELVRTSRSRRDPAGFGPLDKTWPQRTALLGTYKKKNTRSPWFPDDFDWGYFNAASPSMQVDGYLVGDEDLYFENLHPEHATYQTKLPGQRVRSFMFEARDDSGGRYFRDVPMHLDTLFVDMHKEELVLVWRGTATVRSFEFEEVDALYVAVESLDEKPGTVKEHRIAFELLRDGPPLEEAEIPEPPEIPSAEELDAMGLAGVRAQMAEMGVPESLQEILDGAESLDDLQAKIFALTPEVDEGYLDRMVAESNEKLAQMAEEHGLDAAVFRPPEVPTPEEASDAALTPDRVEARCKAGESLAGEDLTEFDLAGRDLHGADFSGAILSSANLAEANLAGANLENAHLSEANLSGCNLSQANLTGAYLTKVQMPGAVLTEATLENTLIVEANAAGADFSRANASGAMMPSCDLAGAVFEEATLEGCDFTDTQLDGTVFRGARLSDAFFDRAQADGVDFTGADLTKFRTSEETRLVNAKFIECTITGSSWIAATLDGSDFSLANLAKADFSRSSLEGATFDRADIRNGDFCGAKLQGATLTDSNLFKANFIRADVRDCAFDGASLFEANFADALQDGASFEDAVLTRAWMRN